MYNQSVFIHIFEFSSSMVKNGTTLGSYVCALVWQFLITPSIIMAMKKKGSTWWGWLRRAESYLSTVFLPVVGLNFSSYFPSPWYALLSISRLFKTLHQPISLSHRKGFFFFFNKFRNTSFFRTFLILLTLDMSYFVWYIRK